MMPGRHRRLCYSYCAGYTRVVSGAIPERPPLRAVARRTNRETDDEAWHAEVCPDSAVSELNSEAPLRGDSGRAGLEPGQ